MSASAFPPDGPKSLLQALLEKSKGATNLAMTHEDGMVILMLPEESNVLGMQPDQAFNIALGLIKHAVEAGLEQTVGVFVGGFNQVTASLDIVQERSRQVDSLHYSNEHDDEHVSGELAAFAAYYAMPPAARDWDATSTGYGATLGEAMLPNGWRAKHTDRRTELVKAAALLMAEIERLDRKEAKENKDAAPR